MQPADFQNIAEIPGDWTPALKALWWDAKDNWNAAHRAVQDDDSADGAWVHAYLHRKEGDDSNARYWYARAGRGFFPGSLDEEWNAICLSLLKDLE